MILDLNKPNNSKPFSFLALNVIVLLYSLGGICSKLAASKVFLSLEWMILYGLLLLSLVIYAITWQQILKIIPLNIAYTIKSIGVIWTLVWGVVVFNEQINIVHLISALFIIGGVLLMTISDKKAEKDLNDE